MDKHLENQEGTICWWLNKNMDKLNSVVPTVAAMKKIVLELLEADEIKNNPATPKAKDILSRANGNAFWSTLSTYLTGMKV